MKLFMLSAAIDQGNSQTNDQLLNTVFDRWIQAGHWNRDPDEHIVIVNNIDSEPILDTAYWGPSSRPTFAYMRPGGDHGPRTNGGQMAPLHFLR